MINAIASALFTPDGPTVNPQYQAPQRTWVGLTDDEMKKTWYEMQNIMGWYSFQEIAQAIEAKLKEKNNA